MTDINKVFVDDESYNSGHGRVYDTLGVDTVEGAVVIVRPDGCKSRCLDCYCFQQLMNDLDVSMVSSVDEHELIGDFFSGFLLKCNTPPRTNGHA